MLLDPDPDEPLMRAEIFGPILPVLTMPNRPDLTRVFCPPYSRLAWTLARKLL